jgi:fucose permease
MEEQRSSDASIDPRHATLLLVISYVGFVELGLPDAVIGVAWPSIRDKFSLPQSGLGLLATCGGAAYLTSSFFAGRLNALLGVGRLLTFSTALVAISAVGYAVADAWPLLMGCALLAGLGSGAIDAGLNALVAMRFSARHVNWLHACYSLGATLGPLLMTAALVHAGSWRTGYWIVGVLMLVLTVAFRLGQPAMSAPAPPAVALSQTESHRRPSMLSALSDPLVALQMAIFFLYTGLELTVGYWTFALLTESRAVQPALAGVLVGGYFGAIGVGRVLCGWIVGRLDADRLVGMATSLAVCGAGLFWFARPAATGIAGLLTLGLALAPIYPCLMSRTPARLGRDIASFAIGFQVSAAMLGGFLLPSACGLLTSRLGLEVVPVFASITAAAMWLLYLLLRRISPRVDPRADCPHPGQ